MGVHARPLFHPDLHRLLEPTLGYDPHWQIAEGNSMPDDRAVLRRKKQEKLGGLKSLAIAALEDRGYEVRGKRPPKFGKY